MLVVGSVALDHVETPFGSVEEAPGGSAIYFAAAASVLTSVQVVGVVGTDYPRGKLAFLAEQGVDLTGVETADGESFRWKGRYSYDLNERDTIWTRLGVFAQFRPRIPDHFRDSRSVFLGNIDPQLQLDVLKQVRRPRLTACDTMNFWIERSREALLTILARVDILLVNDSEARQLAGEPNLLKAARWIQARGPEWVVVKKGEHGAILFGKDSVFFVPGYPLEQVLDPTGAGDAFAGGFLGCLDWTGGTSEDDFRRAMVYGSALGSFAVEAFGVDRLIGLEPDAVVERIRQFRDMTAFELEMHVPPDG
ncbi:MAG: PfkB family carbohydrate kinase [Gemmatimonadota bacterium]|nr:PfkB family carbohydrate kinase [Gemmatimonadota bacterium]